MRFSLKQLCPPAPWLPRYSSGGPCMLRNPALPVCLKVSLLRKEFGFLFSLDYVKGKRDLVRLARVEGACEHEDGQALAPSVQNPARRADAAVRESRRPSAGRLRLRPIPFCSALRDSSGNEVPLEIRSQWNFFLSDSYRFGSWSRGCLHAVIVKD